MGNPKALKPDALPGIVAAFAMETGKNLLARETVRSTIRGQVRRMVTGNREKPFENVPTVERYSDQIIDILDDRQMSPDIIGIDGPPGSGKSTLGRSLAGRTGLQWTNLTAGDVSVPYLFRRGRVYENIRLFRTQDLERLDLILYIDCRIEDAQRRVVERDRNGALADYLHFDVLKTVGDAAFELARGEEIRIPASPIRMKIRPRNGFGDMERLRRILRAEGVDVSGHTKEALLFQLCYGRPRKGLLPYVRFGAYNRELLSGALSALHAAY